MKVCYTCKIEKDSDGFHKESVKKDGLASTCKKCMRKRWTNRRSPLPHRAVEIARLFRQAGWQ